MWFFTAVVVLLIGAVAVVASGRWGGMAEAYDDRPDMRVPANRQLSADDIESSRFAVGVRGYRMDEVDTLLERVAREVGERDRRIAALERAVHPSVQTPPGDGVPVRAAENPSLADTDVVHAPVGRHAARRPPTQPEQTTDPRAADATEPVTDQPTPPDATTELTAADAAPTSESAETTGAAETMDPAAPTGSAETDEATKPAEAPESAETSGDEGEQSAQAQGRPMPVVMPRLRDPEPAQAPAAEDATQTPDASTDPVQAQHPAPAVPRLRDPAPAEPQTTNPQPSQPSAAQPSAASSAADASAGPSSAADASAAGRSAADASAAEESAVGLASGGESGSSDVPTAEQPVSAAGGHEADADTAEIPAVSDSANGAQGGAAEQAERRVWTVHGAPSQTVRPAPKRTDDAVRPAPKPGQQGPKAVPRSVPSAVQETEAEEAEEAGEAEVEHDQSPAERRA
jgi:DivIVA domain-containing protein